MKNQYFGDVNDYRKYGLLQVLAENGALRIGVCWMLTPNDTGPDGKKTEYLNDKQRAKWRCLNPDLYDFLRRKVHGHETESASRDVRHLTAVQIPQACFFSEVLCDAEEHRRTYFGQMWERFKESQVDLIFFDPDDGLANNNPQGRFQPGYTNSAKKLFREEVSKGIRNGFSIMFYQHFDRTKRKPFVRRLGTEMAGLAPSRTCFSFWTPHVVFFMLPLPKHLTKLEQAIDRVRSSSWAREKSCPTSRGNDKRHILIGKYSS